MTRTTRTLVPLFAAAVAATALLMAPSATAQHTPRRCVTAAEYDRVHRGMTKHRAHRVMGARGERVPGRYIGRPGTYARVYGRCRSNRLVLLTFTDRTPRRITSKESIRPEG